MKRNFLGILIAAILLAAISLFLIGLEMTVGYAGLIGVVLLLIGAMVLWIMQDVRTNPDIVCYLSEDAKSVKVINRGTARAVKIHVALVPLNIEADVPPLDPDAVHGIPLPHMVAEAKAVVTYQNEQGIAYSQSYALHALGTNDEDLLKPPFALFGWK
jgi:hypothetical protein